MTAGFTTVFAVFGLVVAPVASSAQQYLPWFTLVVGLVLAGAGLWLLAGRSLPALRARAGGGAALTGSMRSMFGFGISYALASLTCTVAPFLAVVVSAFRSDSVLAGSALFLLYAAGMGLVVGTAAVAVALAQQSLVRGARRLGAYVSRAGGALLALVGGYVAYYGWWEIRVFAGGDVDDPVIEAAASIQRSLSNAVTDFGATGFLVTLAVLIILVVGSSAARGRRRRRHGAGPPDSPPGPAQPEAPGRPADAGRSRPSP